VDLSIVIPAYNEERIIADTLRTVATHLSTRPLTWEIVVVDDGSRDATAAIVARAAATDPRIVLMRNERNQGKGASLRNGMLAARGSHIFFMDADLSVPIEELDGAYEAMVQGGMSILIGSRRIKGAQIERHQPRLREFMGDTFTYLTRLLLAPAIRDFTCGFKGFRRDDARRLFALQRCNDWAFDAEVLYLARLLGVPVHQRPIRWRHGKDSKVRFPRDVINTLIGLVRIRLQTGARARLALGVAQAPAEPAEAFTAVGELPADRDPIR
jgi:dolichyl-phosphate beta-glucosyltransferase